VGEAIDAVFAPAQEPTATFVEKAFVARLAVDVVELVGFARWLGLGCLAAVMALVANAIVLGVQSRVGEHAVLQTLGYGSRLVAGLIVAEGTLIALVGGALGATGAIIVARAGSFALSVEGQTIPIAASPELLLWGLVVCAGLGVGAGLVPAIQASRREIAACFRAV
jgi:putative ABC transport system permease protein